ncbi:LysM domain receptor-like kinase 3 [Ranunculus cassubicifolius]
MNSQHLLLLLLFTISLHSSYQTPLYCTDTSRICTSFIAYKSSPNQTLTLLQSMFDVLEPDITVDSSSSAYIFIKKNCYCASTTRSYLANTTYTVTVNGGSVYDSVNEAYNGLALRVNSSSASNRTAKVGAVVGVKLLCGCSSGLWNYLMSYVLGEGDTIESLSSRFGVSMDSIESVNGIMGPDNVTLGSLYYIPLNSVPGEPYSSAKAISPSPVPVPSDDTFIENQVIHKTHFPYAWTIGGSAAGLLLIFIIILMCISFKSSDCCHQSPRSRTNNLDGKVSHKFHILGRTSFCCASGRSICAKKPGNGEIINRQVTITKAMGNDVFEMEKPVVFTYEEILFSTDSFSDSNLLGHGTYGSVYYASLRDQEVAIKRMTAMKTKEFLAEMKVLCKVHHANLVELIGYAATDEELYLIYEYAQKGSLKSHLHDPQNKGNTALSWIVRVQIALDTARGLEYIHEHTKTHYVHRDIKASNILLDSTFRAKISDFGLAKLIGKSSEGEASATRVVGTFGYLAPEYLSDGLATTKSDVYAFGVVLFELISGKEAITKSEGLVQKNSERRSLASIMLAALRNSPNSMSMPSLKECIDPNLMDLYPYDCVCKVALLAKQCVDDDPILRPDMKQAVISLSQILLSSVEWEATLAGNSQVFSGLVQGR